MTTTNNPLFHSLPYADTVDQIETVWNHATMDFVVHTEAEKILKRAMDWSVMKDTVGCFCVQDVLCKDRTTVTWTADLCRNYNEIKKAQRTFKQAHVSTTAGAAQTAALTIAVETSEFIASVFLAAVNVTADRITTLESEAVPQVVYVLTADGMAILENLVHMIDLNNARISTFNMEQIQFLLGVMYKMMCPPVRTP